MGTSFSIFESVVLPSGLSCAGAMGLFFLQAPSPLRGLCVCAHARACVCVCSRSLPALLEPMPWLRNLNLAVMNPDHQGAH